MALGFQNPNPISQNTSKMDSGLPRAQSALARGVQVTELSDGRMNPEPIIMQESDILMEQYLSPTKLHLLTGADNLEQVDTLELKVDTSETSLNNFGALLPNLRVLKLSGSVIPNIRDLGSSLRNLEVLWMPRCGLEALDGISSMLCLRELYLAYNEIFDISPLSMLEELEILDLEGNNVDDIGQIHYLSLCLKLKHLTLDGNPICVAPTAAAEVMNYNYRQAIRKILVNLTILDDKSLEDEGESSVVQNVFDVDWAYLEELQGDALLTETLDSENETVSAAGRPTTAALKPATLYRPGSALRPSSGFRPNSSTHRPASIGEGKPSAAWTRDSRHRLASSDAVEGMESASELTCGTVICGSPSKALRARRKASNGHESTGLSEQSQPEADFTAASSLEKASAEEGEDELEENWPAIEEKDLSDLMRELQSWKAEHEARMAKIRKSKAPQVLRIEHNSDLSDDSSELSDSDDHSLSPLDGSDYSLQTYRVLDNQPHMPVLPTGLQYRVVAEADDKAAFSASGQTETIPTKARQLNLDMLKEYERSLDEDQQLLQEYKRLVKVEKQHEVVRDSEQSALRELHVASTGKRPPSPQRARSAMSSPFPGNILESSLSSSCESLQRERSRKTRIGPTGLPGSAYSKQPQIRDILSPTSKASILPMGQRSPSSPSSLQHRIRRTLPEVPPLPSRPPPVTKS